MNRHDRVLEAKLRQRIGKNTDQARRSAELAAEQVWKTLRLRTSNPLEGSPFAGISRSLDHFSVDSCQESNASSSERATRRGWRRGAREINEADSVLRDVLGMELPSIDETSATLLTVDLPTEKLPKRKHGIFQKDSRSSQSTGFRSKKNVNDGCDLWMCGVCGKAFATHEAADQHESKHVREVVEGLGWNRTSSGKHAPREILFQSSGDDDSHSEQKIESNFQPQDFALEQWERDDDESMEQHKVDEKDGIHSRDVPSSLSSIFKDKEVENVNASYAGEALVPKRRARSYSDNVRFNTTQSIDPLLVNTQNEQGNALLISKSVLESAVLADEALVSVCRKAEMKILSPAEIRAERELDYLSRDKAYYDKLAAIAAARQARPTDKYRSDGDGVLGKVQNKLLDAYQIMKETDKGGAKTGLTSTDQYDKRWRQPDGNEADDIIRHSGQTLYVNVMVRNSIVVVKKELERLADKRWEKSENNQLDRFERFRVFAHLNIVKLAGIALASDFTVSFYFHPSLYCIVSSDEYYSFYLGSRGELLFSCPMIFIDC